MDLEDVISELRAEKTRLDEIIAVLERLRSLDLASGAPRRRGRKFMDTAARGEVSVRMRNYWAARKREKEAQAESGGSENTSADAAEAGHGGAQATLVSTAAAA